MEETDLYFVILTTVIISTKLTTSPCLVVTDSYAWTANMERLMAAQNSGAGDNFMANYMKGQKKVSVLFLLLPGWKPSSIERLIHLYLLFRT